MKLSRVNVRKLSRKRGVRLDFKRRPVIGSWTYAPIPMTEPVELKVIDL